LRRLYPYWGGGDRVRANGLENTKIAYQNNTDNQIYTSNTDGTEPKRLTNQGWNSTGNWSPDTKELLFYSDRDGNYEIYKINPESNIITRLTNNPSSDVEPRFSPDGRRIVFASDRDGNEEIYIMNADGTNQTNFTNNPAYDGYPDWKPTGEEILFESDRNGTFNNLFGICLANFPHF